MDRTRAPRDGGDESDERAAARWWARPLVVSVTALSAIAVLTLATIVQSPSAKAGSGAGPGSDGKAGVAASPAPGSSAPTPSASAVPPTTPATAPPTTAAPSLSPSWAKAPASTSASAGQTVGQGLREAVAALAGRGSGDLAVAVADPDGDTVATYDSGAGDGDDTYDTASIVKVDILAALLLDTQRKGTRPTARQRSLAGQMIEASDNDATTALWDTIGRGPGLDAANDTLGLDGTSGGPGELWGLTQTTARDQLALLRAVFAGDGAGDSPLSAASRSYITGLMGSVIAEQSWGVSAADSDDSGYALKNGWLQRSATGLWDINSIGEVTYEGRRLLICVLSSGQPSQSAGIDLVESAATAAARVFTSG